MGGGQLELELVNDLDDLAERLMEKGYKAKDENWEEHPLVKRL